jgi:hypothetical protein
LPPSLPSGGAGRSKSRSKRKSKSTSKRMWVRVVAPHKGVVTRESATFVAARGSGETVAGKW